MMPPFSAMNPWDSDIRWSSITFSLQISGSFSNAQADWTIEGSGTHTWTRAPYSRSHRPRLTYPVAPADYDAQPLDYLHEFAIYRSVLPCGNSSHLLWHSSGIGSIVPSDWDVEFGDLTITRNHKSGFLPPAGTWPKTMPIVASVLHNSYNKGFGLPQADLPNCSLQIEYPKYALYESPFSVAPYTGAYPVTLPKDGGTVKATRSGLNCTVEYTIEISVEAP
jgi:hypothetical protein